MIKTKTVVEEYTKTVVVKKKVKHQYPFCDFCGVCLAEDESEYCENGYCTYDKLFDGCTVDICEDCTNTKLIPWLESQRIANEEHSQKKNNKPTV